MIAPILNYGCEVWGLRKADPIDTFYLSFLKTILGVKTSTPSCYVYGELGVYPMIVERKFRMIKFWLKIIRSVDNNNNYVQKVYKELIKVNRLMPMYVTWVSQIKSLLENCGFGYIWQQQAVANERKFLKVFKQRLMDMSMQEWSAQVNLTSDGRLFKHIKLSFQFESYLDITNKARRVATTRIRLSSHIFNVERGRWSNIVRNERKCIVCDCIEDEFHCLVECPRFNNERRGLLTAALENMPNMNNFITFLKSNDVNEQKKLGLLCLKVQKEYRELM